MNESISRSAMASREAVSAKINKLAARAEKPADDDCYVGKNYFIFVVVLLMRAFPKTFIKRQNGGCQGRQNNGIADLSRPEPASDENSLSGIFDSLKTIELEILMIRKRLDDIANTLSWWPKLG